MKWAFIVGCVVAVLMSYFSVFVVQRKMAFLGSGLAHSSFAGVAIAMLLEIEPFLVASLYTLLCGFLVVWLRRNTQLGMDTMVGVVFSFSMALGAILIALSPNPSGSTFRYLFGSLLGLDQKDFIYASAVLLLAAAFIPYWPRWGFSSFDPELARSEKSKVFREDLLLIFFVSLSIAVSLKILGMILLAAFLVLPAASARLISKSLTQMSLYSVAFGLGSCLLGLSLSYWYDLPSGAAVVMVLSSCFVGCFVLGRLIR